MWRTNTVHSENTLQIKTNDHKRTPKNVDINSFYNRILKEKNMTGTDQNHSPMTTGTFYSNLYKWEEIIKPSRTLLNHDTEEFNKPS